MCSTDPLERAITASEKDIFSKDSRADEYTRLMDASEEIMNIDVSEENKIAIGIDRCLSSSDRHPHT